MVDPAAAVAVDLLPVVAEEPELWGVVAAEEVLLDGLDPAGVGVLVLVDQDDRVPVRQDAPELGMFHEGDGEEQDIVVVDGDAGVVNASVPELVLDATVAELACFSEFLRPVLELGESVAKLFLETSDQRPAEGVDGVAVDKRAAVGAGLDLVLGYVGEGDAGDLLVALRKRVPVAVDEKLKCLDERVRFAGAGAGFDEKALLAVEAVMDPLEGPLAGLLGWVRGRGGLSHRGRSWLRGHRRRSPWRWPLRHPVCRRARASAVRRGCSREGTSRCRRWRV